MPTRRDSLIFTITVTVLVVLGAGAMALVIGLSGAPGTMILATVLAAVPVGPVIGCFLWLDRYEPEPKQLLAAGLAWGAFVATAAALVLQGIGGFVVGFTERQNLAIVAPITEEATKGAFLLLMLWWRRHELDGILDGIVYAGMVGVGFAFVENILYLAAAYDGTPGYGPGGVGSVTSIFVLRCLISPFAHPLFTAFTGIGVGIAINSRGAARLLAPAGGYLLAVGAHALWNSSTLGGLGSFAGIYLAVMFPALVGVAALAVWARRSEQTMLTAALADAARQGLLPAADIPWLVSLQARRTARDHAARFGPQAVAAMRSYQQAATELGFLHHRFLRGTAPPDFASRGRDYVERIKAVRPYVSFPGQVVPAR